jgi:HD-like signal output (HDOD) protein
MDQKLEEIIRQVGELPPLPQAAQKALSLIRNPRSNMSEVANVLVMDQVMTSLVLRWVNSAYYGLAFPVATVQQAVVYLGQNTIQSLILAASVATFLDRPVPGYGLERGELWKHSIGVASGARLVAVTAGLRDPEEAYHAGLLCDIGKLAFEVLLRNKSLEMTQWQGRPFVEFENTIFGVDHALLGAELARRWNLPVPLQIAIANHHHPSQAGDQVQLASAVHIADAVMMMLGVGIGKDGLQYILDPVAFQLLGWNEAKLVDLIERVSSVVKESEDFMGLVRS